MNYCPTCGINRNIDYKGICTEITFEHNDQIIFDIYFCANCETTHIINSEEH